MLGFVAWTIAGVLAAAVVAAFGMLCMPLRINVVFDTQNRPAFFFKVALFNGLLPVISTAEPRQKKPTKQSAKPASYKSRASSRRDVAAMGPRMLRQLPKLASKLVSRVKLERLDARIRFGLSDPADTGIVYGALIPLLQLTSVTQRSNIVLHPDFGQEVFDGRGHVGARLVPIALIAPMLGFAWATMVLPRLSGVLR